MSMPPWSEPPPGCRFRRREMVRRAPAASRKRDGVAPSVACRLEPIVECSNRQHAGEREPNADRLSGPPSAIATNHVVAALTRKGHEPVRIDHRHVFPEATRAMSGASDAAYHLLDKWFAEEESSR